jgi:drug/metabolite transporter (DMT)-like permease
MKPGRPLFAVAILALCVVWGTTWKVIQIGLQGIPPFSGAAMRFALASLLLLGFALVLGVRQGRTRRERWLWLVNSICSFAVSYGVVYWAEQWVPSGLVSVLFATYPLFIAVLGHFLLPSESLSRAEFIGILIGFGGVAVIFSEDLTLLGGPGVALASVVMLASPAAAAVGSLAVKRWGKGIHPISFSAVPMGLAAGMLGAVAFAFERQREFTFDAVSVGAMVYLAIVGSALTFTVYFWLLSHLPVKRLALIAYVIPIVAVSLGIATGERLTPRILLGAGLVVLGVAMAVQRLSLSRSGSVPRTDQA